jgi:hypothetical protein
VRPEAARRKFCPFWIEETSISIKILNPFRVKVNPNKRFSCRHATTPKMSKLLGGYGQQPTSSPGHGGWQQPTLKADLSTWANGLVTGRYCWQTELCVPCSTSEDTALAALQRQFLLAAPSTCSKQPRMFVGSLSGDIIGLWWVDCMAQSLLASVCTVAVRRRVFNSPLNPGVGNNPIGIFYDASRASHHRRRGNKGASSPAP